MSEPSWLKSAVIYEIYPQSFYDTNGDGIGDLPGVIAKLDYIKSLGVTAVWLNPFYESPFGDAGYDVSDYKKVAPRYGTNEDFKALCKAAHEKGIRVLCDLVPGHTSIEHPWFKKSASGERNECSDRYIWCEDENDSYDRLVSGSYERKGRYYCNFYWIQPALNFGFAHPSAPWQMPPDAPACLENRALLRDIMDYWISLGCDGFRVDMAASLVKNDPDYRETQKLWQEIRAYFDKEHPECVLIPEWSRPFYSLDAGFHTDMFLTGGSLFRYEDTEPTKHSYFRKEGQGLLSRFMDDYEVWLEKTRGKGYISFISGNHDLPRVSVGRTEEELKPVFAFLLTMPGAPVLYYGDEIAMRYLPGAETEGSESRGGSRTPMQWRKRENAKNFGFSSGDTLYLPQDGAPDAPSVEQAEENPDSLLHCIRKLTALRRSCRPLWADGAFSFIGKGINYPMWFERSFEEDRVRVLINATDQTLSAEEKTPVRDVLLAENASFAGETVTLGAFSCFIYRV